MKKAEQFSFPFYTRRWALLGLSMVVPFILLAVMLVSANLVQAKQLQPPHQPLAVISGTVVNPDGTTISEDTTVRLYALNKEGYQTWERSTDVMAGDGHFAFNMADIPPEVVRDNLFVQANGYARYFNSIAQLAYSQDPSKPTNLSKVKLTFASFTGMVYAPSGEVVTKCLDVWLENDRRESVASTQYCGDNPYQLGGVPDGNFRLTAAAPDDSLLWNSEPISVSVVAGSQYDSNKIQRKELKLQLPNFTGKVVYPNGLPVTWVYSDSEIIGRAFAHVVNEDWSVEMRRFATTAGEFGLKLPSGNYQLWAEPEGKVAEKFTRSIPRPIKISDLALAKTGPLTLTYPTVIGWVNAPNGQRITACLSVWLEDMKGEQAASTWYCGAEGPYRLGGVEAGVYWLKSEGLTKIGLVEGEPVKVTVAPDSQYQDKSQPLNLTLKKGDFTGELRFPIDAICMGCPVPRTDVRLRNQDWTVENWTDTAENGRFVLGNLVTGTYILDFFLNDKLLMDWEPPQPFSLTWPTTQISQTFYLQHALHTKKVVGKIAYQDGSVITNAQIYAYSESTGRWLEFPVKADGSYEFYLGIGVWKVGARSTERDADWYFTHDQEQWVEFLLAAEQEETKTVNFSMEKSTFLNVTGQVKDPHGNPPPKDSASVNLCTDEGLCFDSGVDNEGKFHVRVTAGTYHVWLWVDPISRLFPPADDLTIKVDADYNIKTIQLHSESERTAQISGHVVISPTGEGLKDVEIEVQSGKQGWDSTTTITDGTYSLNLMPGPWHAGPILSEDQQLEYVVLPPDRHEGDLKPNDKKTGVDFFLARRDAIIQGRVVDSAGKILSDIDAVVFAKYCSPDGKCFNVDETNVQGGSFKLRVVGGRSYKVGVWLSDQAYMAAAPVAVEVKADETKTGIDLQLLTAGTKMMGSLQDEQGNPVKIEASIHGSDDKGKYWIEDSLWPDKEPYQYNLSCPTPITQSITWTLGLWVDPRTGYIADPTRSSYEVVVGAGVTEVKQVMFVKKLSDTIKGKIEQGLADGKPVPHLWAFAEGKVGTASEGLYFEAESNEKGEFAIPVLPGEYLVGAHLPLDADFADLFQPEKKPWTSMKDNPIKLEFRAKPKLIGGQALEISGKLSVKATASLANDTEISVFGSADDGTTAEVTGTLASGFHMAVISNTIWHIWAVYEDAEQNIYYKSEEKSVRVGHGPVTQDLVLSQGESTLPDTYCETFDPTQFKRISLPAYGKLPAPLIEIPAGTMPVTDTVQLCATPKIALPNGQNTIGFAYDLEVRDSLNNLIKQNFNKKVRLIFYLSEGTDTKNLQVAYYSDTRQKWVALDDLFIDKEDMFATGKINHFSRMGVASVPDTSADTGIFVYLPIIVK